jgi:nitrite reductase/ring-hydroxylating ferredoxin subunit
MKIEFTGHAGFALRLNETVYLMDPWFSKKGAFASSWFQFPSNHHYFDHDFKNLDSVFISHEHLDHYDKEYLESIKNNAKIYIPGFPTAIFKNKIKDDLKIIPKILSKHKTHDFGDFQVKLLFEESPMNQDSVWIFKSKNYSIVNTVDSRLNEKQVEEILEFTNGSPDVLMLQFSGASWYPACYEDIDKIESEKKLENKLTYGLKIAQQFSPDYLVANAGPPIFLDYELQNINKEVSFINPGLVIEKLKSIGYKDQILAPMPNDLLDLENSIFKKRYPDKKSFSWFNNNDYVKKYSLIKRDLIQKEKNNFGEIIDKENLYELFKNHFYDLFKLNDYFNKKINSSILFNIIGINGGEWLVTINEEVQEVRLFTNQEIDIQYEIEEKWIYSIIRNELTWEEFFLSCRFRVKRFSNKYNDHFLGLLKFADRVALKVVEKYEQTISDETITVNDGKKTYVIDKYCPHAGASLENSPIEEGEITCLLHNYIFDLETGKGINSNCHLRKAKIVSE